MTIDIEKVKGRIKKLINLSKDAGATEAEAERAMEKAMALMAEYQLTAQQVDRASTAPNSAGDIEMEDVFGNFSPWKRIIFNATASLYMCDSWQSGKTVVIIGESQNIEIAKQMADHFIAIGEALASQRKGNGRSFIDAFKKGFASRLAQRLRERKAEAQKQEVTNSTGTALVLANVYDKNDLALTKWKRENDIRLKSTWIRTGNCNGSQAGKNAANGVSLGQPLRSSNHAMLN